MSILCEFSSVGYVRQWVVFGVRVLFHISISRISIYTKRAISAQLVMFHVMEFYLWPNLACRNNIEK